MDWRSRIAALVTGICRPLQDGGHGPKRGSHTHPLDGSTSAEYWTVYDRLQKSGHSGPETIVASVLLREPDKPGVLSWKPSDAIQRQACVVLLEGGRTFSRFGGYYCELKDANSPCLKSLRRGPPRLSVR
jgi:Cu2+-containing amine oxidase